MSFWQLCEMYGLYALAGIGGLWILIGLMKGRRSLHVLIALIVMAWAGWTMGESVLFGAPRDFRPLTIALATWGAVKTGVWGFNWKRLKDQPSWRGVFLVGMVMSLVLVWWPFLSDSSTPMPGPTASSAPVASSVTPSVPVSVRKPVSRPVIVTIDDTKVDAKIVCEHSQLTDRLRQELRVQGYTCP